MGKIRGSQKGEYNRAGLERLERWFFLTGVFGYS
jgi:hypothetical protein